VVSSSAATRLLHLVPSQTSLSPNTASQDCADYAQGMSAHPLAFLGRYLPRLCSPMLTPYHARPPGPQVKALAKNDGTTLVSTIVRLAKESEARITTLQFVASDPCSCRIREPAVCLCLPSSPCFALPLTPPSLPPLLPAILASTLLPRPASRSSTPSWCSPQAGPCTSGRRVRPAGRRGERRPMRLTQSKPFGRRRGEGGPGRVGEWRGDLTSPPLCPTFPTSSGEPASSYLSGVCGCRPLAFGENLAEYLMDFLTQARRLW
jgi:hypothetical protein